MAFEELKQRQSVVWGSAPFEKVAGQIANVHDHLVSELAPQAGESWLDVGTGTGGVAVRAARAGAVVTGSDLAPVLIETARRLAADEGLEIRYEVGDAEQLPYEDASFDIVSSSFGAMFAPDHSAVAGELARVTRPGGRLGMAVWDPDGGIGDFFRLMGGFQPPPPEGAGNPLEWGREQHARELLEDAFDLRFVRGMDPQLGESGEELWQVFVASFGPLKTLYDSLEQPRREELHNAYVEYMEQHRTNGRIEAPREYVIILGTRR
ncbi:MAG: class I SAM-dependent methyltransferase [Actinomycetota bacterium]|nr:class I SAM-dependent methyltransferase [Actinomycetota bacterium]